MYSGRSSNAASRSSSVRWDQRIFSALYCIRFSLYWIGPPRPLVTLSTHLESPPRRQHSTWLAARSRGVRLAQSSSILCQVNPALLYWHHEKERSFFFGEVRLDRAFNSGQLLSPTPLSPKSCTSFATPFPQLETLRPSIWKRAHAGPDAPSHLVATYDYASGSAKILESPPCRHAQR